MEAAIKTFFSAPRFAVAGASSDPSKFGHRVLLWYLTHNLPVTPINPSTPTITFSQQHPPRPPLPTIPSVLALPYIPSPSSPPSGDTSLSIITPPATTLSILRQAKKSGVVRAVWLQPGSFDAEGVEYARREWPGAAVAGMDGEGSRGGEGWCVLVDGEAGLEAVGRKWRRGGGVEML